MTRRWYVVLAGSLVTLVAIYLATHQPPVYWTQFNLVLLAPAEEYHPNKVTDPAYELAPLASLLVMDWNGTKSPLLTSTAQTTLFGEGVRDGIQVRLPNQGSQFVPLFTAPYVDVQVVGSTREEVERRAVDVRADLTMLLKRRQDLFHVDPRLRVSAIPSPAGPDVQYISGSRTRATLATGLAGAAITMLAASGTDRALDRRRLRRRTTALTAPPADPH